MDRESGTSVTKRALGIESEGFVKRCHLEGGKRPSFSCFCVKNRWKGHHWKGENGKVGAGLGGCWTLVDPGPMQQTDSCLGWSSGEMAGNHQLLRVVETMEWSERQHS